MIPRRALLATPLALAAASADAHPGVPHAGTLAFSVYRKGHKIGRHVLTFHISDDALEVRIDARIEVTFGPITLYRYRLACVERHRNGRFVELESQTDNDGESLRLAARRDGDVLRVDSSKLGKIVLPADALPLTHWSRICLSGPIFNPQDGKLMHLRVTRRDGSTATLADGREVAATCFSLAGEAAIDDWYDEADVWTALRATATDGSIVTYRRIT